MPTRRMLVVALTVALLALPASASAHRGGHGDGRGKRFYTTAGPLTKDQVGNVLAHHHMFVELGAAPPVAYLDATPEKVYDVIGPWVEEAKALGIGVFVEFTPEGVGRRPDIVKYVADRAGLPTMLVTGIYREPFMPAWVFDASVEEIAAFMTKELRVGVTDTGVPAGIIKLSQNDTGMTLTERKVLKAACKVARRTGAAIASHITRGPTALSVMDALENFGCPLDRYRFIWVHAHATAATAGASLEGGRTGADPGIEYLLEAAERGAYVSLDGIGSRYWGLALGGYDVNIGWIRQLIAAGHANRIIIGADTGWYDPGFPAGFEIAFGADGHWHPAGTLMQDYRSIPAEFVPAMRRAGFSERLIRTLMHTNPWNAYSR